MDEHRHDHDHHPQDAQGADLTHLFTEAFWDERYASSQRVWSGNPNAALVQEVADLAVGTALDVGCGEGADVVWLAQRGWHVTGVDVSGVALSKAAEHAAGAGVADRTSWQQADVFALDALPTGPDGADDGADGGFDGGFDLVTASYVHVPPDLFADVYRHVASAVAPGGTLVVLAHHPDDTHTGLRNSELSRLLFTPEAVVALLAEAGATSEWEVVTARVVTRDQVHEGVTHVVSDTVVRAVRHPLTGRRPGN